MATGLLPAPKPSTYAAPKEEDHPTASTTNPDAHYTGFTGGAQSSRGAFAMTLCATLFGALAFIF
jgi:hypothetical protein